MWAQALGLASVPSQASRAQPVQARLLRLRRWGGWLRRLHYCGPVSDGRSNHRGWQFGPGRRRLRLGVGAGGGGTASGFAGAGSAAFGSGAFTVSALGSLTGLVAGTWFRRRVRRHDRSRFDACDFGRWGGWLGPLHYCGLVSDGPCNHRGGRSVLAGAGTDFGTGAGSG